MCEHYFPQCARSFNVNKADSVEKINNLELLPTVKPWLVSGAGQEKTLRYEGLPNVSYILYNVFDQHWAACCFQLTNGANEFHSCLQT